MKHRVDQKILLDVINPWSRVDRNILVSLWEKIHAYVRKIGVPTPLIAIALSPIATGNKNCFFVFHRCLLGSLT